MSLRNVIISDVESVFLNLTEFAETVTFHLPSGPVSVTAIVQIDDPLRDDNGETMSTYTGQVSISETDYATIEKDKLLPLTMTVRNEKWNVIDSGNAEHGMTWLGIRRQERRLPNAVGLDGKQKRYGKISPNP